jgi:flagellar biosynthesis/type III secretory pathway chaperone
MEVVAMDKEKLSKLRHDGHITDAEYKEMIRLCDRDQELIRKLRELQQTALKNSITKCWQTGYAS